MKKITTYYVLLLLGCATQDEYVIDYDPNAQEISGRIIYKKIAEVRDIEKELDEINNSRTVGSIISSIFTAGIGFISIPVYEDSLPGNPTEYHVVLSNENKLRIYSFFTGHKVGDCVTVFLSKDYEKFPPSMTSRSGECD